MKECEREGERERMSSMAFSEKWVNIVRLRRKSGSKSGIVS